jgi:predicted nucleic acid-binding protein
VTVVLDTSVLIDHLRGDPRARDVITGLEAAGQTLSASVLTKVELLAGMRPAERSRTRKLIEAIDWLEVDDDLGERAGALASRFLKSHPGIELVDYVIAATAERFGADLVTRNRKHFPMFPELRDPYEHRA